MFDVFIGRAIDTVLQVRSLFNFHPLVDHLTLGAIQAYRNALSQELLYPAGGEVEKILRGMKGKGRNDSGG
ncbi:MULTISPECIES: hypothetical protein [unclassified Microcoleus]|uniref:hypothetical protein n=1 Tax=unclassified Microcoleus TaxID=2642155 RepID=UPI001D44A128|nr:MULTISPECIES: hypothetical protein [unclassified Microcoleus]MCC3475851.1 hypothetical protein [Microcoleus sp. PH2017_13_LAR_U_A]MCC3488373.1 hypothetical protein [Microcoleus sp. PH2017_14_LAR_D_A]MCC3593484.1 hypothetical protein [Microcoleus sp. PH2017_28_MFU_U_A]MCC3600941.1 hypothetical protein [Microcoleus sp. PH2017_26_ELK_O_A]MCC3626118.1 hypothetical protein [Microcoleus sp. PH2017_36_ELK_O_B]